MTKQLTALLLLLCALPLRAQAEGWTTIENGRLWTDDRGQTVQAHAPGFLQWNGRWYMIGEDRSHPWTPDVNLYSSTDLQQWRFEGKIIENSVTTPTLGTSRFIERAKLFYNQQTRKFIVWCHWEGPGYRASEAACFVSDSINGRYRLQWSGRPMGIKSRDCNIFTDDDGSAYFISTTSENTNLGLFRLSDDYLRTETHTLLMPGMRREAPVIVRVDDIYYMLSSACTGWAPNQCMLSTSKSLHEGWTPLEKIGDSTAFRTQAAAIIKIEGTKQTTYLYIGDRWLAHDLAKTRTIMFPVYFENGRCIFEYRKKFDINFQTGEIR